MVTLPRFVRHSKTVIRFIQTLFQICTYYTYNRFYEYATTRLLAVSSSTHDTRELLSVVLIQWTTLAGAADLHVVEEGVAVT